MNFATIIAGGAGTRLWPMSRSGKPKQLLPFINGQSLLKIAVDRLAGLIAPENLYICTNREFVPQIHAELRIPLAQLLGEPVGRDTVNAVGFAAAILQKCDPDAALAILTADHIISPIDIFQNALRTAFDAVQKHPEFLITFGITPTYPATGYGYLHRGPQLPDLPGVHRVLAFKEKPKAELAAQYVASGEYAWNSGMFIFKAATMLEQIKQHLPASYSGLMKIAAAWGTPEQDEVLQDVYPTLPKISLDFAIMEKAPHVATVAMPIQWLDVGSWPAYAETLTADAHGNRASGAPVTHLDSSNTLIVAESPADNPHLIATINCQDLIIIHTPRATLVCPAKDAERIKQLVAEVEKTHGKGFI